jgi:predicted N-acetyltransferase YhbS
MPSVRPELPHDAEAIRALHEQAFAPSHAEARLVDLLRAAGELEYELCLVAVDGERVVGHIAFSRARVDSGHEVLALAPMAVLPERQSEGIGESLVREALHRARATRFPLVVVLGHAAYYPRFGFGPASDLGIVAPFEVPPEAWMALKLPAYRPEARGVVTYADAFAEVG